MDERKCRVHLREQLCTATVACTHVYLYNYTDVYINVYVIAHIRIYIPNFPWRYKRIYIYNSMCINKLYEYVNTPVHNWCNMTLILTMNSTFFYLESILFRWKYREIIVHRILSISTLYTSLIKHRGKIPLKVDLLEIIIEWHGFRYLSLRS